ncbi:MAG TPA: GNAT family protein [Candidatus Kapabacteria bacterium]|nr:GNAT family protein [Candidatus Kapabacteria bacterium]
MNFPEHEPAYPLAKRIETKRLVLRFFDIKDAAEYYDLEQKGLAEHMKRFMPGVPDESDRDEGIALMREKIRTTLERSDDGAEFRFLIREKERTAIIGQIGITNIIRNVAQSAFIGYWIGADWLGKGYATEACAAALAYSFETLRLHRVSIWIAPENTASLRVVEKIGLRFEGTAVRALFQGGKWADTNIYAITSEEWNERKNELHSLYA